MVSYLAAITSFDRSGRRNNNGGLDRTKNKDIFVQIKLKTSHPA